MAGGAITADDGLERALRARLGRAARICGVDEAGRGPWAGPVHAAAVIFAPGEAPAGLADSKTLSAARRAALAEAIKASAAGWAVAFASVEEIDAMGVGRAADLAMCRAVGALGAVAAALVDGNRLPRGLPCPGEAAVGGDARSVSIAAASILAKTVRDAVMDDLDAEAPVYGWARNRGYGTPEHAAALARYGVTQHHRRSFRPIHKILVEGGSIST